MATKAGFRLTHTSYDDGVEDKKTFEMAQFFDTKNHYIQQVPPLFSPLVRDHSPFHGRKTARDALISVMKVYRGKLPFNNEPFLQKKKRRDDVNFGILIPYALDEKK